MNPIRRDFLFYMNFNLGCLMIFHNRIVSKDSDEYGEQTPNDKKMNLFIVFVY